MPEPFWTILWTAMITLLASYFTYWLAGKPRLIVYSPNSTFFDLKSTQDGVPNVSIRAGQVIVQNNGRTSATDVQFVAAPGLLPWGYNIVPSVDHVVRTGSRGEWILQLPYLGPGENVTVQILNGPNVESVRSREGPAKTVPVIHQRLYPPWVGATVLFFSAVGLVATIVMIFKAGYVFWRFSSN